MTNNIQPYVMPNLAFVKNGRAVTTTYAISQWAHREHRSVFKIVSENMDALKKLGEVSLEVSPVKTKTGVQTFRIATLNEDQASFVICSMRNSEQAKNFKVELLLAFRKCREQLALARKTYSDEAIQRLKGASFNEGYKKALTENNQNTANKDMITTRELASENGSFAFGIKKDSLVYEYLKLQRKIKANQEQWEQEVKEFNEIVNDACGLSEEIEKLGK